MREVKIRNLDSLWVKLQDPEGIKIVVRLESSARSGRWWRLFKISKAFTRPKYSAEETFAFINDAPYYPLFEAVVPWVYIFKVDKVLINNVNFITVAYDPAMIQLPADFEPDDAEYYVLFIGNNPLEKLTDITFHEIKQKVEYIVVFPTDARDLFAERKAVFNTLVSQLGEPKDVYYQGNLEIAYYPNTIQTENLPFDGPYNEIYLLNHLIKGKDMKVIALNFSRIIVGEIRKVESYDHEPLFIAKDGTFLLTHPRPSQSTVD